LGGGEEQQPFSSSSSKVQKADPVIVEPKVSNTPIVAVKEETKEPQKEPDVKSRVVEAPADDEWNEVKVVSKQDKRDQVYKKAPKPKITQPASQPIKPAAKTITTPTTY